MTFGLLLVVKNCRLTNNREIILKVAQLVTKWTTLTRLVCTFRKSNTRHALVIGSQEYTPNTAMPKYAYQTRRWHTTAKCLKNKSKELDK